MNVYFGKVVEDTQDCFEYKGKYFDYILTYEGEDLFIKDSCGRCVPIDIDNVNNLLKALKLVKKELKNSKGLSKVVCV